MNPKITIITPTIDSAHFVDIAIDSVPRDECAEIEHIVVHDGSREFGHRLQSKYPWVHLMQGPGRGATAAVAAAISAAKGEFIIFLNSDDRMLPGSLAALMQATARQPEIDVWTGGTRIFENTDTGDERTVRLLEHPEATALTLANVLDDLPMMTARFVRRSVYERVGNFDAHFSGCSDREFAIRMVVGGVKEAPLGVRVSELRLHAQSRTIRAPGQWVPLYLDEHLAIARQRMAQKSLSPEMRAAFRDWHARETARKIFYELRAAQFPNVLQSLRKAFRRDALWPWHARSLLSGWRLRRRESVMESGPFSAG